MEILIPIIFSVISFLLIKYDRNKELKNKNKIIYKTDKKASLVILFFLFLMSIIPLTMSPIDWERAVYGILIVLLFYGTIFLFFHVLSYIVILNNSDISSSLLGLKKQTRIPDIIEIQRMGMYKGLSAVFGKQAFIIYKKLDGSTGYFGMSENLYDEKTMTDLFSKLAELNKNIKIDPYYVELLRGGK